MISVLSISIWSLISSSLISFCICVGTPFDIQAFVDNAVKRGEKHIVIPPGKYHVTPKDRQHLQLGNLHDIEIIADGVEMICSQTTRAVSIWNSKNLTLRGLTIDYDPLPFTQGHITGYSTQKDILDIQLFDGYPDANLATNFKIEIFAKETRTLRTADKCIKHIEAIDAKHLRIVKCSPDPNGEEKIGDIVAIGAESAPNGSIPHAVTIDNCVNIHLINIDLWASNCFGFIESNSENTIYERCRIDRRPSNTDIVKRADPRIRSLDADAFHSKGAPVGPKLIECTANFMGDDAVNIHGSYDMVTEKNDKTLRVLIESSKPTVGDKYEIVTYEGVRLDDATVTHVVSDGKINAAEKLFLSKQRMDEGIKQHWNPDAYRVTFDRSLEVGLGAVIASTKKMGNGFTVRGCKFGWNRSRGILIKASDGNVVDNTLIGSRMAAVLVSPEYWWLESGSSINVNIKNNTIDQCGDSAIKVEAYGGAGNVAPSGAHKNIVITGNHIKNTPWPQILVTSTNRLQINDNTCSANSRHSTDPNLTPIVVRNSSNVEEQNKCN